MKRASPTHGGRWLAQTNYDTLMAHHTTENIHELIGWTCCYSWSNGIDILLLMNSWIRHAAINELTGWTDCNSWVNGMDMLLLMKMKWWDGHAALHGPLRKLQYHSGKAYEGTCRIPRQNGDGRGTASARFVRIVKAIESGARPHVVCGY